MKNLHLTDLYYRKVLQEVIDRINKGISLVNTMAQYPELYPVNSISVLAVGENSGTLEESFFKISDYWTKEILDKTRLLPTPQRAQQGPFLSQAPATRAQDA